jgi:phosphatidate cytidylyltransferase
VITRRIIAGVLVALAWFLGLCYMPGWMLFGVLLLMSCACQNEFYVMMKRSGFSLSRNCGLAMGALWLAACYAYPPYAAKALPLGHQTECMLLVVLIFGVLLRVLFDSRIRKPVEHVAITLLGFFYLPFMLSFFIRLAQWGAVERFEIPSARVGVYLASYIALVVKIGDVGAFAVGLLAGKHKMCPRISPKKSWEGFAGGLAASMLASVAMIEVAQHCAWVPGGPLKSLGLSHALALGLVLALVGVLGDLVESMFKRAVNIKDSAGLLPGMGGILDMFDSLTFTPAVLYFYLAWFVGQAVATS